MTTLAQPPPIGVGWCACSLLWDGQQVPTLKKSGHINEEQLDQLTQSLPKSRDGQRAVMDST
ncbi:MAG: hypothetical protein HC772_06230 [Leptolyngbyaceae cyanobacterium CRU_2_3]|nr:hypothetical protein [Leptolyngbyaceae cyanobacterium CRU_2_3]